MFINFNNQIMTMKHIAYGSFGNAAEVVHMEQRDIKSNKLHIQKLHTEDPIKYSEWARDCADLDRLPEIFGTHEDIFSEEFLIKKGRVLRIYVSKKDDQYIKKVKYLASHCIELLLDKNHNILTCQIIENPDAGGWG